ncbi:Leucine-rich repeat serine/threonine-protein kinase 1 [Melipona quadrifasciata]|uniref:non-specific serine/threonine protein kinase n=1 Tax=Melipona quadrifasciata TaxID=166423 RepID=A0A0M9A6K7_9HYME|nr:Leucine-rich repeat serine/threonine-protein kinase 1 [Melipona quadrifasciata]
MEDYTPIDEDFPGRLLHQAALWDNAELLEDLLRGEHAQYINSQDSWGRTPLHAAAITENSRCLDVLLSAGANPNISCGPRGHYRTPLHICAEHGHNSNIEKLLKFNANLMIQDNNGERPLDVAEKAKQDVCINLLKSAAEKYELAKLAVHASLRAICIQGDIVAAKNLIQGHTSDLECIINMAPNGANTLLFIACEMGHKDIVRLLLDYGADCRMHPVTKYCPLYIACYNGKVEIVELLLRHFPKQVQSLTVEKWLPIHVAAINGHHLVIDLLLKFEYPQNTYQRYKDSSGEYEYEMPFDINTQDVTGQNVLYISSMLGNIKIVELLLNYKVKARKIKEEDMGVAQPLPISKRKISSGIQRLMSSLNFRSKAFDKKDDNMICPLNLDLYCNNATETSLHAAVKGKHTEVVAALLSAGADPNLLVKVPYDQSDPESNYSSALIIACQQRDIKIADLLLKHGAVDNTCKAIKIAAQNRDEPLTAKLLSIKAYPDSEYKINKKAMTECTQTSHFSALSSFGNVTYSALFPNTPTMINWHDQQCHLSQIRAQWLTDAVLHVNKKLSAKNNDLVLYAITRIDISLNSITSIPSIIFYLQSLRYLNMAQNKIDTLTAESKNPKDKLCPVLEEMYLQDNRLEQLPEFIMNLPALEIMDVSNNKLQCLPDNLWRAPKLKELNASFNLLKTLPNTKISYSGSKSYLLFPNVSMLDVSNNKLKEIPQNIYELNNLSVLNISGNSEIVELPPQMGLLSRLWNLNTQGCRLQEPLKTMIESKKYKTMDVIGYLKSILEDAKPYARMKLMIVGIQGIGKTSLLEQLRQEGEVPNKKKAAEHWAKRMGNKNINAKTARGTTISTVGVDIGDWIYEKKVRGQSSHGPVYFRTWDFGGQREYYATHQYFLSKRSLYLVVWRIIDGFKGVSEIFQWLVNIQSRAPNSPVIIVGTHYDISYEHSEALQQYIRDKFINVVDAEKCGLPKVMETIEVSCKTKHNIKMLCNLIYDVVFSLRSPGSKELLLEQKVPASYLALEDVVIQLAHDRKLSGGDPVLKADQYYMAVNNELQKLHRSFRDPAELHQATLFLHENGIILHYDDATLKDLYFLDPQWLCDMLAHVVTIREINPFARCGIMKLDDIQHVFKSSTISSIDTQGYIVSLLNKFEVALTWDYRTLLIPSLLPTEEDILRNNQIIKIPVKTRGIELKYSNITLLRLKEVNYNLKNSPYDYRQYKFKLKQDGIWCTVDLKNSAILEIWFPVDTLVIKQPIMSDSIEEEPMGYQAIVVEPRPESMPQLLALIVDHIDILLEDWYPTLGTRFVHTSEDIIKQNTHSEGILAYSWMVEECILSAYSNKPISCPKHFDIPLSHVAPDIIFMDLGSKHLIKSEDIKLGKLLGRGAFGFVFKGPNSKQSAILAYKAAQSKWDRDPLQYACKAYCTARQELNILLTLRHTNIVPLIGIVVSPLALVLDLAPEGALDNVLKNYRRSGAKLDPYTLQAIILQVAKAVEYLHQQHVIYRDLKSENVLVWQMPLPFQNYPEHPVHGISRLTLPTGAKGFGGTEGFMAPEIIKYNGEEEYTEKVDSFSFGMFIYELITLRQPFEGHEAVKECILEGGRPPLTYRETFHPCYALDLMVICWAQNPKDRPTASQIVSIASAPEFTHLIDVILLTERTQVTAITMTNRTIEENLNGDEIWFGHNNGEVDMLLGTQKGWLQHVRIETPIIPYAMCGVDGYIWIGDDIGQIHVYLGSNFGCVASYNLELDHSIESKIVGLIYLEQIKQFAVALHSGKTFLLSNSFTQMKKVEITTDIQDSVKTYSLAAVYKKKRILELWVGQSFGKVSIYVLKDNNLIDTVQVSHGETVIKNLFATHLLSAENCVLSYTYPGCIVYQWDVDTRQIINKLDMSKLVPCSESLKSISIEENLSTEKCQVTALETCRNQLYIGTTWGCIVVAECNSLRPITVFRPFEGKVCQIISFKSTDEKKLILATVGQGYRSLISRYTDFLIDSLDVEDLKHSMYALLWRSEHWSAA